MNSKKPIFMIDCQLFQTNNGYSTWHRGMGKYTFQLLKSLSRYGLFNSYNVELLFNNHFELEANIEKEIFSIFENAKKVALPLKNNKTNEVFIKNKKILNQYFDDIDNLKDAIFFAPCPFEQIEYCVLPDKTTNFTLFWDLIPMLFHEYYLSDEGRRSSYYPLFRTLFDATHIFTISETSKQDLIVNLGISPSKVTNIDGALIPREQESYNSLAPNYMKGIKEFILMPTGDDMRKNNINTVKAFNLSRKYIGENVKLVITSFFSDETKDTLLKICPDGLIFTGNCPEYEMDWLYKNCNIVLFGPLYEGLGLPILEAISYSKPISCSNIPVFKEISKDAFYYFSEHDIDDIKNKIISCFKDNKIDIKKYEKINNKYTWSNSAKKFTNNTHHEPLDINIKNQSINIFAPHSKGYSSIAKDNQKMYASFHDKNYIPTYYLEDHRGQEVIMPSFLDKVANSINIISKQNLEHSKDRTIYHIGNSEYHQAIWQTALKYPDICIIHDTNLSGLFGLLKENKLISEARYYAEELLNSQKAKFLTSIVSRQKAIIVHSNFTKIAIRELLKPLKIKPNIYKLNLPLPIPTIEIDKDKSINPKITVGMAGILADSRGLSDFIDMISTYSFRDTRFIIFGFSKAISQEKKNELYELENVDLRLDVSELEYQQLLKELDILVNFRSEYNGETSMTTLQAMGYGVVPIIRNIGWFSELDDNMTVKIDHFKDVPKAIEDLSKDKLKLRTMSNLAINYIMENHSMDSYVDGLITAINDTTHIIQY
jgi:glycosyltransferase involved in cell wall biosynthesis